MCWRHLVRDCDESVEAVFLRNFEISFQLFLLQSIKACLHLNEGCPLLSAAGHTDEAVREDSLIAKLERHLDEGLYVPGGGAERADQPTPELTHGCG